MLTEEALVESLFVGHCSEIIKKNKRIGVDINDRLSKRAIGLFLSLAERDFYSFLQSVKLITGLKEIGFEESRSFILDNIHAILDQFPDAFPVSQKTVFLSNLFLVYGINNLDENVVLSIEGCLCKNESELRAAYSAMRLIIERPQFLLEREKSSIDQELFDVFCHKLENYLSDQVAPGGVVSPENILFIFGHAQPLPYIGSHWRQVITYVGGFCDAFPEKNIKLIVTNESVTVDFFQNLHALPKNWEIRLMGQAEEIYGKPLPINLSISLYNPASDENALSDIVKDIKSFSPSVAFSWLGFFSSDIYFKSISKICTIFSIQFQAGNRPNRFSSNIFCQGDSRNQPPSKLVPGYSYINSPIPLVPENKNNLWRKVKAPPKCFNLVTTLGNHRIEKAFSNYESEFLSNLIQFLNDFDYVTWSFVGVTQKDVVLKHYGFESLYKDGRIFFYERVEDLRSFYQFHSAYVHMPKMYGGGWGIGLAVFEGLPVLCQSGGDADNFLPSESLFYNEVEFFEKLASLISDEELRSDLVDLQAKKLRDHSPVNVAKNMYGRVLEIKRGL